MNLDGVFMDMYGTLTTGDRAAVESVCALLVHDFDLKMTAHELSITWGNRFFEAMDATAHTAFETLLAIEARTLKETMHELGITMDPLPYAQRLSEYWRSPPLQPEVPTFLADFPLPICIVSNADTADVAAALTQHDIRLAGVVTSEDTRHYKPDPRIFDIALRTMGWDRNRVLHVGDSLHSDVGGARAASITSVWVNRAHRIHDVGQHEPDHALGDLTELLPLIQAHFGRQPYSQRRAANA